jgi:hypothetical protein
MVSLSNHCNGLYCPGLNDLNEAKRLNGFERLEQPHSEWTACCLRSSRLREQNRNSLAQNICDGISLEAFRKKEISKVKARPHRVRVERDDA